MAPLSSEGNYSIIFCSAWKSLGSEHGLEDLGGGWQDEVELVLERSDHLGHETRAVARLGRQLGRAQRFIDDSKVGLGHLVLASALVPLEVEARIDRRGMHLPGGNRLEHLDRVSGRLVGHVSRLGPTAHQETWR